MQGIELQEKELDKHEKHIRKLIRNNPHHEKHYALVLYVLGT